MTSPISQTDSQAISRLPVKQQETLAKVDYWIQSCTDKKKELNKTSKIISYISKDTLPYSKEILSPMIFKQSVLDYNPARKTIAKIFNYSIETYNLSLFKQNDISPQKITDPHLKDLMNKYSSHSKDVNFLPLKAILRAVHFLANQNLNELLVDEIDFQIHYLNQIRQNSLSSIRETKISMQEENYSPGDFSFLSNPKVYQDLYFELVQTFILEYPRDQFLINLEGELNFYGETNSPLVNDLRETMIKIFDDGWTKYVNQKIRLMQSK